jgi:hypothetical protein
MKKFAKLSLVAAVAVAGLSTTSSAASLEEAIKGVDVSGQFRYRTNLMDDDAAANKVESTDVEIEVGVKVPVTDNVTAVFKIDNENNDTNAVTKGAVEIEDYYFSYANGPVTVNFGQQNIPGRMTDGGQGDGVVALYNAGAFTVGAAYFLTHSNTNATLGGALTQGENVASVIAMGNVGPVSLLGQYANIADVDGGHDGADAYNLKADATVGPVTIGAEHVELDVDGTNLELETTKAYISAKAGIVSATLTYAQTGDNGSGSIDAGAETPSEYLLWNVGTAERADFDVWAIDATVAVTDKLSLRAAYAKGEEGNAANNDVTEALAQVSYKVSKNLNTYIRYADVEDEANAEEFKRSRLEIQYTF